MTDIEKRNRDIERFQRELDAGNVSKERRLNIEASLKYLSKRRAPFRTRLRRRSVPNGEQASG